MRWMTWKTLIPPATLPLAVSVAVAIAGPGGLLGLTQPDATPAAVARHIVPPDGGGSGPGVNPLGTNPTIAATSAPTGSPTHPTPPVPTPPVKPSPLPSPPPSLGPPTPPPESTATPAPTQSPPGPLFLEAEAVAMAKDYTITSMPSVVVQFNWCTGDWLGTAWGAICEIVDPACKVFTDLGLLCPLAPLQLDFYLYESGPVITPADAATTLILDSY